MIDLLFYVLVRRLLTNQRSFRLRKTLGGGRPKVFYEHFPSRPLLLVDTDTVFPQNGPELPVIAQYLSIS